MGNELDADLISGACPESISDHPKLALGWLSQVAYFIFEMSRSITFFFYVCLFVCVRKKKNISPIMTPEPRPQAKSYFI